MEAGLTYADLALMVTAVSSVIATIVSICTSRQVQEVHLSLNSRLTELLRAEKEVSRFEGVESTKSK